MSVALSVLEILCNFILYKNLYPQINVDASITGKSSLSEATFNIDKLLSFFIMYAQVLSYRALGNSLKLKFHKNEATSTNAIMWKHLTYILITNWYQIFHSAVSFNKIEIYGVLFKLVYNAGQNIWNKIKKASKIGQDQKTLIKASA